MESLEGRKRIDPGQTVDLALTGRERRIIIEETAARPELKERIDRERAQEERAPVRFTLGELEQLIEDITDSGYAVFDEHLRGEVDRVVGRIQVTLNAYEETD